MPMRKFLDIFQNIDDTSLVNRCLELGMGVGTLAGGVIFAL
jgi:hypothetical protein